jgi:hypothetical protein
MVVQEVSLSMHKVWAMLISLGAGGEAPLTSHCKNSKPARGRKIFLNRSSELGFGS